MRVKKKSKCERNRDNAEEKGKKHVCRQSRLSRVATTTTAPTTAPAPTLADLDCGFSRPAAVRGSGVGGFGLWIFPAGGGPGVRGARFLEFSIEPHKFIRVFN